MSHEYTEKYIGDNALFCATRHKASVDDILKLIKDGGAELLMMQDKDDKTVLHVLCEKSVSSHFQYAVVILNMIDIGGTELLMMQDKYKNTALHVLCQNHFNSHTKLILKMIDLGGAELLMMQGQYDNTALHNLCENHFNSHPEAIIKMIDVGGAELLMIQDKYNNTALHRAVSNNRNKSKDVILKMIDVGGTKLLMMRNKINRTVLHVVMMEYHYSRLYDIFVKLLEVGGAELVLIQDQYNKTALHMLCGKHNSSKNWFIMEKECVKLLQLGGAELVMMRDQDNKTALHILCEICNSPKSVILKVLEAIGEAGIISILMEQTSIYPHWKKFSRALWHVIHLQRDRSIDISHSPPLLQAAIRGGAPRHVILEMINRFNYCVMITDNDGKLPIIAAIEQQLGWNAGMKVILKATAAVYQSSMIYVAARYGLQWMNHMKELVESQCKLDEVDAECKFMTGGLNLFMVAAMEHSDLSTTFELLKRNPNNVITHGDIIESD